MLDVGCFMIRPAMILVLLRMILSCDDSVFFHSVAALPRFVHYPRRKNSPRPPVQENPTQRCWRIGDLRSSWPPTARRIQGHWSSSVKATGSRPDFHTGETANDSVPRGNLAGGHGNGSQAGA
jgi:hypothetical protein